MGAPEPTAPLSAAPATFSYEHEGDRQFATTLARGLEVLRCFTPLEPLLGNKEISVRTGLPKPTVSRLTYTLTKLGYLRHNMRLGKYQLGSAVLSIGYPLLASMNVRQVARPLMKELADYCNGSVSMGVRDRLNMVYVESSRSGNGITTLPDIGTSVPIAQSVIGRAFLAACTPPEREAVLNQMKVKEPEAHRKYLAAVNKALDDIRARGFCASLGELQARGLRGRRADAPHGRRRDRRLQLRRAGVHDEEGPARGRHRAAPGRHGAQHRGLAGPALSTLDSILSYFRELDDEARVLLVRTARIAVILLVAWLVQRFVGRLMRAMHRAVERRAGDHHDLQRAGTLGRSLRYALNVLVVLVAGMLVLGELGISVAPILATAGVAGIAIGFGAQSLIKDYFNGFFILVEDQIREGDVVEIVGKSGLVEEVTLRFVRLRDADGHVHFVPERRDQGGHQPHARVRHAGGRRRHRLPRGHRTRRWT